MPHLELWAVRRQLGVLKRLFPRHHDVLDALVNALLKLLTDVARAIELLCSWESVGGCRHAPGAGHKEPHVSGHR